MADDKDNKESPPPSDSNTEIKADPNDLHRMLKIISLPEINTKNQLEDLIEELTNEEIRKDIEDTAVHVNNKNKTMAIVTFKTAELARQAKSLILDSEDIVFRSCTIGTFDIQSGKRLNPDGTPLINNQLDSTSAPTTRKSCHICKEPGHFMKVCPNNILNKNSSTSTVATKRPASEDAVAPVVKKSRNYGHDRSLKLTGLPLAWCRADVNTFLKENTKEDEEVYQGIQFIYMDNVFQPGAPNAYKRTTGKCHVLFATPELCAKAKDVFQKTTTIIEGRKIWAMFDTSKRPVLWLPSNKPNVVAMKARDKILWGPKQNFVPTNFRRFDRLPNFQNWQDRQQHNNPPNDKDNWVTGNFKNMLLLNQDKDEETYGLSTAFLEAIGVTLPLKSKIFVDSLSDKYDDENKIRQLFSHAGTVKSVAIIARVQNHLKVKVEFDHPIEAVQAITMFHDQEIYGRKLRVNMDKNHNAYRRFLPDGLTAFGPGLGSEGAPMKNVRNTIELQKAVNMIMNEIATLKIENENNRAANDSSRIFSENQTSQSNNYQTKLNTSAPVNDNIQNLSTLASSLTNPLLALSAFLNPQANQMLQLLTRQNAGSNLLAGLNTPQTQVNPQPEASTVWNINQPAVQNTQPGYNYNMPSTSVQGQNMQSAPNMQGYNMQGGTNMLATPSSQQVPYAFGQNMQAFNIQNSVPYMQAYNMQSSVSNIQGVPNVQSGSNLSAGSNLPAGPNIQGGPHFQGASNMQGKQLTQGDAEKTPKRDECTVLFNYLPPSVSITALQSKMREVGELRSAELTGPGQARVSFYSQRDADNCIKIFDRSKVDSQMISVRHLS